MDKVPRRTTPTSSATRPASAPTPSPGGIYPNGDITHAYTKLTTVSAEVPCTHSLAKVTGYPILCVGNDLAQADLAILTPPPT